MITTCSKCGKLYETTTEEADAPDRECHPCWRARQDWAEDRPSSLNQCDGCHRGLPVDERGIHVGNGGPDMQVCTADRYRPTPPAGGAGGEEVRHG